MHRLFQEYYSASTYRPIRQLLDEPDGRARLSQVLSKLRSRESRLSQEESKILYDLTDFLSFFEFIAFLRSEGALTLEDCKVLFHHYLQLLAQQRDVVDFMRCYGYGPLLQLLEEVTPLPASAPGA